MPLIETSIEIRKHFSAVEAGIDPRNVQSFIDDAINNEIIPAIGRDQFEALVSGKANFAPDSKEKVVFDLIQKSAVNLMLSEYADAGALNIDNTGISVTKGTNRMPASDAKLLQLKRQCLKGGYNSLELAVNYLERHLADFPLYAADEAHLRNRALLLNTSDEFQSAGVNIGRSAQLYKLLRIYQDTIENTNIVTFLGSALYGVLQAAAFAHTANAKQKQLISKLHKPIAYLTMIEGLTWLPLSIDPTGVYVLSESIAGQNKDTAELNRIMAAKCKLQASADMMIDQISSWLNENKTDFPDYAVSEGVDINDGSAPNVYGFL